MGAHVRLLPMRREEYSIVTQSHRLSAENVSSCGLERPSSECTSEQVIDLCEPGFLDHNGAHYTLWEAQCKFEYQKHAVPLHTTQTVVHLAMGGDTRGRDKWKGKGKGKSSTSGKGGPRGPDLEPDEEEYRLRDSKVSSESKPQWAQSAVGAIVLQIYFLQ